MLVKKHAKKEPERVRVEKAIGFGIASDGEISLHGAMIARDRIGRSRPLPSAR